MSNILWTNTDKIKGIGLSFALFITLSATGQELIMHQLGPKADDEKEIIKEFNNFIIYMGGKLNRKDAKAVKTGEWIEYRKANLQRTIGAKTLTDSTNASYVIEMLGHYTKGKKNGLWNIFYRDGRIKESIKYD